MTQVSRAVNLRKYNYFVIFCTWLISDSQSVVQAARTK